jgi:predicted nuclease of predicted toxin-antitoxin system
VKLLFDQNLSPRLVTRLTDVFPDSQHVFQLGLDRASDEDIWTYARDHEFMIVTKDADFSELSALRGFPPKVLWLCLGNCTTAEIEALLRGHQTAIQQLFDDSDTGTLTLL